MDDVREPDIKTEGRIIVGCSMLLVISALVCALASGVVYGIIEIVNLF